jgi:general secretion pathway protein D
MGGRASMFGFFRKVLQAQLCQSPSPWWATRIDTSAKSRLLGLLAALLVLSGCGAGNVAFREGRRAERQRDWDTALVNYERAVRSQPDNAQFLLHEKVARTQASLFHLKQGRRFLSQTRMDEAAGEFRMAVSIDPTNEAADQELAKLLAAQAAVKRARETALKDSLMVDREEEQAATVKLKPFPSEPLARFRITADTRKVFETLGKLAELNVVFTKDFQPSPVTVDLASIKIEDAFRAVCFQTKTFWRAVTPNTILVVPDTPANRRDYEEEVVRAVYLSNPLAPADRTAITTTLKQVLGLQRIVDNPDSNAIILRDTPAKAAAAERLIHELDRGKAEILVEVAVIEADRSRTRDLGLTTVATSPLSGSNIAGLGFNPQSPITVNDTTYSAVPLSRLGRISTADFSIVLPGAVANALLSDSHTHVLQNPQVRVTDGSTAKLRIGTRIPYATGSFLPSLTSTTTSGGSTSLLASTQFQYQDVGVNLDLTPRLLANGEVALHASIEISSLGSSVTVAGVSEPTFGQRKIEHDIRLKEGEVSLLGGLIQSTESQDVSGLPGLGDIPFLRYLFSAEHRERSETEVLVMLTPWVIRLPDRTNTAERSVPPVDETSDTHLPARDTDQVPEARPPQPPEEPQ